MRASKITWQGTSINQRKQNSISINHSQFVPGLACRPRGIADRPARVMSLPAGAPRRPRGGFEPRAHERIHNENSTLEKRPKFYLKIVSIHQTIPTRFGAIRRILEKCSFSLIRFITWPRGPVTTILRSKKLVLTFPYTLEPVSTLSKDGMNTLKSLYQILYHLVPKSRILWVLLIQKWNHWSGWRCGRGRATKLRGNSLSINTKRSRPISGQSDEF